jgi:hypothetical protein
MGGFTQSKLCSRKLEQAPALQITVRSCIIASDATTMEED